MDSQTKTFANIVAEYCNWAESTPKSEPIELKTAIQFLANLYAGVLYLAKDEASQEIKGKATSQTEWKRIYDRFGVLPVGYYSTFFNPIKLYENEPSIGDVADNLADIYKDLKEGLDLYQKGYVIEANWQWRHSFDIHWGRHATSALQALHTYATSKIATGRNND